MKSLAIFLFITGIVTSGNIPQIKKESHKPYEVTWMELTETDSGYVVCNYPHLLFESKSPEKIIVRNDSLTWITFSDPTYYYSLDSIQNLGNEKYYFPVGNHFQFEWFDKEKHIARWIVFNGYGEIQNNNLYIDSLYNTYPIVDFIWE